MSLSKVNEFIERGKYKQGRRDIEGAYEEYSNLIKYDPKHVEGYSLRGYLNLWYFCEFEDAKNDFKKALEIKPNHSRACYGYGSVLCKFGDIREGVKYFEKSAEIDSYGYIYHEIGERKLFLEEKEDALEAFINAAELELKDKDCFYENAINSLDEVVILLINKREFNNAINYLNKIIEIRQKAKEEDYCPNEYDEEEQQSFYSPIFEIKLIALCFYLKGDYEDSINTFNKVIKYDWFSEESFLLFQSYILRGQALLKSNKVEEAYLDWEKVNCIEYIGNQIAILEHFEEYVFNSFAIKIEFKECREYFSKKIDV